VSETRDPGLIVDAICDFFQARFLAKVEQVLARLPERSAKLLEYKEVRKWSRARGRNLAGAGAACNHVWPTRRYVVTGHIPLLICR
jgi:hypothetical protein